MKPKRLPRLWCALQGLLPLDASRAAAPVQFPAPPTRRRGRGAVRKGKEPHL